MVCLAIETPHGKPAAVCIPSADCIREPPKHILHSTGSFQRFANTGKKTAFNPHRFVPAQFNEFYRQCSRRPLLRLESFAREHPR